MRMNGVHISIAVVIGIVIGGAFMFLGSNVMSLGTQAGREQVKEQMLGTETTKANTNVQTQTAQPNTMTQNRFPMTDLPTELAYQEVAAGTGVEAVSGKKITVHYTGYLPTGEMFDSSVTRGTPFSFVLGEGRVIQGWEQGFAGMKVGGKRTLIVPPSFGYGSQAVGSIPANSTLIFDVELLGVE